MKSRPLEAINARLFEGNEMAQTITSLNPFRPATRRQQAKSFFSIYSLLLSYRDQFFTAEFFKNLVPPYGDISAVWQHPAGKG